MDRDLRERAKCISPAPNTLGINAGQLQGDARLCLLAATIMSRKHQEKRKARPYPGSKKKLAGSSSHRVGT